MSNAIRSRIDMLPDHWQPLRDLCKDEPVARMVLDAVTHRPEHTEAILADTLALLIRENARYREHALQMLMTLPNPPTFLLPEAAP